MAASAMERLEAAELVERILRRIQRAELRAAARNDGETGDILRQAWWTVHLAFYERSSEPVIEAERKVYQPPLPEPMLSKRSEDSGPCEVDGRTGQQWFKSIMSYLEWRSGQPWRRVADRFNPTANYYLHGLRTARDAFNGRLRHPVPCQPPAERHNDAESRTDSAALGRVPPRASGQLDGDGRSEPETRTHAVDGIGQLTESGSRPYCREVFRVVRNARQQHRARQIRYEHFTRTGRPTLRRRVALHELPCGQTGAEPRRIGAMDRRRVPRCCGQQMLWKTASELQVEVLG